MTIKKWDTVHCMGMLVLALVFLIWKNIAPLLIFSIISVSVLFITCWKSIAHLRPPGGIANRITLLRFSGLILLVTFHTRMTDGWITIVLFLLIIFDGLDGYAARIRNERTVFGAFFDMETDAIFVCFVSCMLFNKDMLNWIVLIPAFLRYFYIGLIHLAGMQRKTETRTSIGPVVAVIMFLVLAADFILPAALRFFFTASAGILLLASFTYSFILLLRQNGDGKTDKLI